MTLVHSPEGGLIPTAPDDAAVLADVWRCFHCDEVFTTRWGAAAHFGADESAEPACKIKGGEHGLLEAMRRAERDASDAWFALHNESSTTAKAFRAMQGRHLSQITAAEQVGYERGLRDAQAHPETLGLTRTTTASSVGTEPRSGGVNQ